LLIGLTGTYCAGKNHVATLLADRGLPVLDVDKLGHVCLENRKDLVFSRFGPDVKTPDGSIDRRKLGAKVFGNRAEMAALEAIVHLEANRMTLEWISAHGGDGPGGETCVINAALLHKSVVFGQLDHIILVHAPWIVRLIRARRRDGLPLAALLRRFASQKQFASQYLAGSADIYRVGNPGIGKPVLPRSFGRRKTRSEQRLEQKIDTFLANLKP